MQSLVPAAFLSFLAVASADVLIYSQKTHKQIEIEFRDLPAAFGEQIPIDGIRAFVVYAKPANACAPLAPPPTNVTNFTGRWAVLIQRYGCSFEEKVRRAQNASYDIAIVHNVNSSELDRMHASNPDGILIPSIFVGGPTGSILKENYQYFKGYYIIIDDDSSFDINTHLLLPFAIVTAVCFLTMIGFMLYKCIKDHRRARRHRLPNSSLKEIPTAKFRKGDPYETCAICLEDYVEGEKLRILPCSHAYHCSCIDRWLTRNRRVCPVCKRRVFGGSPSSDSDSVTDDDDNTPLLNTAQQTQGGTFRQESNIRILQEILFHFDPISRENRENRENREAASSGPSTFTSNWNVRVNQEGSDYSSIETYSSASSSHESARQNPFNNSPTLDTGAVVEVVPRSPSMHSLVGSHEEVI